MYTSQFTPDTQVHGLAVMAAPTRPPDALFGSPSRVVRQRADWREDWRKERKSKKKKKREKKRLARNEEHGAFSKKSGFGDD